MRGLCILVMALLLAGGCATRRQKALVGASIGLGVAGLGLYGRTLPTDEEAAPGIFIFSGYMVLFGAIAAAGSLVALAFPEPPPPVSGSPSPGD